MRKEKRKKKAMSNNFLSFVEQIHVFHREKNKIKIEIIHLTIIANFFFHHFSRFFFRVGPRKNINFPSTIFCQIIAINLSNKQNHQKKKIERKERELF